MSLDLLLPKRPQLYRCAIIHRKVKAGSYPNASRLSSDLEVHRRTIMRDLRVTAWKWFLKHLYVSWTGAVRPKHRNFISFSVRLCAASRHWLISITAVHWTLIMPAWLSDPAWLTWWKTELVGIALNAFHDAKTSALTWAA